MLFLMYLNILQIILNIFNFFLLKTFYDTHYIFQPKTKTIEVEFMKLFNTKFRITCDNSRVCLNSFFSLMMTIFS